MVKPGCYTNQHYVWHPCSTLYADVCLMYLISCWLHLLRQNVTRTCNPTHLSKATCIKHTNLYISGFKNQSLKLRSARHPRPACRCLQKLPRTNGNSKEGTQRTVFARPYSLEIRWDPGSACCAIALPSYLNHTWNIETLKSFPNLCTIHTDAMAKGIARRAVPISPWVATIDQ